MINESEHPISTIASNKTLSAKREPPTLPRNSRFNLNPDAFEFKHSHVKNKDTLASSRSIQKVPERKSDNFQHSYPTKNNALSDHPCICDLCSVTTLEQPA